MLKVIRTKLFIPAAMLAGLLVASFGLVACGGGGGPDAAEIVKKTFTQKDGKSVKAGKIALIVKGELKGIKDFDGPFDIEVSGPFNATNENQFPAFDLEFSMAVGKTNITAGALSDSDKLYVSFNKKSYSIPDQLFSMIKQGYEQAQQEAKKQDKDEDSDSDDKTSTTPASALGIDPESWLTDVEKKSDVDIGGQNTYQVSGKVDVAKIIDDVTKAAGQASSLGIAGQTAPQLSDADKKELKESFKDVSFTLNSTKDDFILVRFEFAADFTVPEDQRKDVSGLEGGNVELSYELTDIGKKPEIIPPEDAKPLEDLLKELGLDDAASSLGLLSGGTLPGLDGAVPTPDTSGGDDSGDSATTTTPPTTGGPSSEDTQEYLKCVQKAKGPEDLQKCVEKLQK